MQGEGGVAPQQLQQQNTGRARNGSEAGDGFAFGYVAALRQAAGAATREQRLLERTGMLNRRLARLPISGFVHASLR
jgi:hypothetical protein